MKILIMVLSVKDNSIYENLIKTIRYTWDSDIVDDVKTIYYYGNKGNDEIEIFGDEIFTKSNDNGISTIGYKVIESLEYVIDNFQFDYLFKMNCSSYLNKKMLKDFLLDKPISKYCCGIIGNHNKIEFTSGSGSIFSRDIVELIVSNKKNWDHSLVEDVSIGKILKEKNIKLTKGERIDIINGIDYNLINKKCYHYRCKNKNNRNLDISIMKELYKIHKKNG